MFDRYKFVERNFGVIKYEVDNKIYHEPLNLYYKFHDTCDDDRQYDSVFEGYGAQDPIVVGRPVNIIYDVDNPENFYY